MLDGAVLKARRSSDRTVSGTRSARRRRRRDTFEPSEFQLWLPPVAGAPYSSGTPSNVERRWGGATGWAIDVHPAAIPTGVIEARSGDTSCSLNVLPCDWAFRNSIVRSAWPERLGITWDQAFNSRWKLDAAGNVAVLEKPTNALKNFVVPLQPMLGCVAVAPAGESSVRTTDSGRFGGNMDYNQLREGTTIYLPVSHPGALLFLGDGHAAQGDGELTGDALETSMDFEFTLIHSQPELRSSVGREPEFLISIGIGGSPDQALSKPRRLCVARTRLQADRKRAAGARLRLSRHRRFGVELSASRPSCRKRRCVN